jgi:polyphosphate kinase 2
MRPRLDLGRQCCLARLSSLSIDIVPAALSAATIPHEDPDMDGYKDELAKLQTTLVRWQQGAMESGQRAVVILEGRDTAGKDGAIKRITEHLSVRATRVVALPKPTEDERSQWYFQRYVRHLPSAGELVIFNRSWYNRGGVEPVMGFCTPEQHEAFLKDAPNFEALLKGDGMVLIKLWLDISKSEQAQRLKARRTDPLKALKTSPLDAEALKRWDDYSTARDEMLRRTDEPAGWSCVIADSKKKARIAILRHLIAQLAPKKIAKTVDAPDPAILFPFTLEALKDERLAR